MFNDFDDKQLVIIFALVSFFSVVIGLGVYFFLFPVVVVENDCSDVSLGVDPWALQTAMNWNKDNQGVSELVIDSCNKASRVSEFVWQVELKKC